MNRREAILTAVAGIAGGIAIASTANAEEPANPELEAVRALLKKHDEAFTNQDMSAVMSCLTEKAAIMGTGPGEIWANPDEIKDAYQHFFSGFDKGDQSFEYQFKIGGLSADSGWLMASGNVKGKKGGKEFAYPLNISLTVTKKEGNWLIAAMHFSTLTGGGEAKGEAKD